MKREAGFISESDWHGFVAVLIVIGLVVGLLLPTVFHWIAQLMRWGLCS